MKHLMLLVALISAPAFAGGFMTHEEIVSQMQKNKVGKAPQQCARGKNCKGPKPKYNKASEILPKKKHAKKHNRKKDYSKVEGAKK